MTARKPRPTPAQVRKRFWEKITRDLVLFSTGIILAVNEVVLRSTERPYVLIFIGGMLGLPSVLRADEKRREMRNGDEA